MFKSKESVGPMIGGAVIGVAVGMLFERIRSPRSAPQPPNNEETARPVCCESVKKRSSNLQVPSHRCKDQSHRHHRRSRSACKLKTAEKPCSHLSVSAAKSSVSESDLRSRSAEKRYSSRKLEIDSRSRQDFLDTSTEYLLYGSKAQKNLRDKTDGGFHRISDREAFATASTEYLPIAVKNNSKKIGASDINDRKADFTPPITSRGNVKAECDEEFKVSDSEFIGCETEYLKPRGSKNYFECAMPASVSRIAGGESSAMNPECASTSIGRLPEAETANWSIDATCDTLHKESDFDSYREDRTERKEELEGSDSKEFVTLPTFDNSGNIASTDYIEINK